MFTLHWHPAGCSGQHVRTLAHRRHHVCWRSSRGTVHASVYLRRDGLWGWQIGDYRMVDIADCGETAMTTARPHIGVAPSRREAQRQCLRVLRGKLPREGWP